jgi:hypothetical protein
MGRPITNEDIELIGEMDLKLLNNKYVCVYIALMGLTYYLFHNFI